LSMPTSPEPLNAADGADVRPWYRKKRYVIPLGLLILVLILPTFDSDPVETEEVLTIDREQAAEVVTETVTEVVTEAITEEVTEVVTERPTDELNRLRRIARERRQTINQLRRRIRSLRDQVAAAPAPAPAPAPEPAQDCDPNYDPCVPIASDVDCLGGSGNGPEYVAGPVTVIGSDVYNLDGNNDGVGCES
jgi:hypothetical protein